MHCVASNHRESKEAMSMKKQITLGLIASALTLSTAAFAPTEAQATEQEKRLNQMAMQMYMNNQAIAAQQQYYNNPYYYNNGYYNNRVINGNGWYNNHHWNDNRWNNNGYDRGLNLNSVGRIINRIF